MPTVARSASVLVVTFLALDIAVADDKSNPKEVLVANPEPIPVSVTAPVQVQGPIDVNVSNTPLNVNLPAPVQAQVIGVPNVTVVGTPGVTIQNGPSSPVPVSVPEPVITEDAAVRTPFGELTASGSVSGVCDTRIDAPDSPTRLVIETVSTRISYDSSVVAPPAADVIVRVGGTPLRLFFDLGKWKIAENNQGYASTMAMRLYPDPGSEILLRVWNVDGIVPSQCVLIVSGYTLSDSSPSLAP